MATIGRWLLATAAVFSLIALAVAGGWYTPLLSVGESTIAASAEQPPQTESDGRAVQLEPIASVPMSTPAEADAPGGSDAWQTATLLRINPVRTGPPVEVASRGNITCPAYRFRGSKSADGKHTHEAMVKYTRYVRQYCNATGMLQMHLGLGTFLRFMDTIAVIAKLRPGAFIFDWGSGCGTMLNYYNERYNTTGVGIDVTEAAVVHARSHGRDGQLYCFMDGSDLRHFPSSTFDAVVSWATLYHIRRTLVQCDVLHQLVRMLKPGGVAFIGHLRTEKTQEYWKKGRCRPPNATVVRRSDHRTFNFPGFRRNNFFSIIVTKDGGTTAAAEAAFTGSLAAG